MANRKIGEVARSRRAFLERAFALAGAAGAASLPREALGQAADLAFTPDYGPLAPVADVTTGLSLLELPEGFTYSSYGWTGDVMKDGYVTPPLHDGMGVAAITTNRLAIVRNHEVRPSMGAFGPVSFVYDPGASGGTTTLTFDTFRGKWSSARASLSGTSTNCAGGPTPWGTWLSCEETLDEAGAPAGGGIVPLSQPHGWVFEVPGSGKTKPVPLRGLGRFFHEAVAVEPVTGFVYETEDRSECGFYRFVPNRWGRLSDGGSLFMMKVEGEWNEDLTRIASSGAEYPVEWAPIDEPERAHSPGTTDEHGVFDQGYQQGGAVFRRLEGCWYDSGSIYFTSTSGGAGFGQIWEYDPRRERLRLVYVSPGRSTLDGPDNLTVSPRGGILLCEDGSQAAQRLRGLTSLGEIFDFARNHIVLAGQRNGIVGDFRRSEWAGATFSPDGRYLFVNVQLPGVTFAITGPWTRGAL